MTSFILILIVVALFAILLTYESAGDGSQTRFKASGLFTWLISGNWPAKVGAGLVIIGVGALLRYAFANIDVPTEIKLSGGALLAALLGFAAMLLKNQRQRRAIHLALGGAAFGVAYLTAYSAYGIFNYINDVNALALLALVAMAAGVFAVTSNAMSVAILAMVGAYIAPKFAIGSPGVLSVYGYFLAASVLSLIMVTLRGWRPLIHLSFLFTLAGALFFGWDGKFYAPEYYSLMQPLLLALTAVHLAMPLLERKHTRSTTLRRFDSAYFLLLPLVAAGLTLKISPNLHAEGALGLGALGLLWAIAALLLALFKRADVSRHGVVAAVLAATAILASMPDLPWQLLGLGLAVVAMAAGAKLNWPRNMLELACGAAALFGVMHIIFSIMQPNVAPPFLHYLFAHRMIASVLMLAGTWIGVRQSITFAKLLGVIGGGWASLSILAELMRLHIDFLPQLVYSLILGAIFLNILFSNRLAAHSVLGGLLIFGLIGCGWWATQDASSVTVFVFLTLTPVALLGLAWAGRDTAREGVSDFTPSMAIGLLPFALLPWAITSAELIGVKTDFYELTIAIIGVGAAGFTARFWLSGSPRWNDNIQPLHVYLTALVLLWVTLFHIERGIWPVAFEILALAYLIAYVTRRSREQSGVGFGVGTMLMLSLALVLQAMLLRGFGPASEVMNAADINKMQLPAVGSLMWAIFGAGLAWWGTYGKSRSMWSAGAMLLVVAAVKLVLFDFGELGQLGNILAFIAAGVVFLGVAWFAPIPPKPEPTPLKRPQPQTPPSVPPASAATQPAKPDTAAPQSAPQSKPEPTTSVPTPQTSQSIRISPSDRPSGSTAHPVTTMQRDKQKESTTATHYRKDSNGINWLWFFLLGFAILIAVLSSAWNKHSRRQHELQQYRQQLSATSSALDSQAQYGTASATSSAEAVPESIRRQTLQRTATPPDTPVIIHATAQPIKLVDACTRFTDQLPSDYVLYAAGGYKGRGFDKKSNSARDIGRFDVYVNAPGKKVVLALGAYESSTWQVRWEPHTNIVGIFVSGYHEQTLLPLPGNTPILNTYYGAGSPCGHFHLTRDNANRADATLRKLFGRSAEVYSLSTDGRVDLGPTGAEANQSGRVKIERYTDENGRVGYREAAAGR